MHLPSYSIYLSFLLCLYATFLCIYPPLLCLCLSYLCIYPLLLCLYVISYIFIRLLYGFILHNSMHWPSSSLPLPPLLMYASMLIFNAFIPLFYAFKIIFLASISSSSLYALILRSYVHSIHIFPPFFRVAMPRLKPGTFTVASRRASNLAAPPLLPFQNHPLCSSLFTFLFFFLSVLLSPYIPAICFDMHD
jgi:hypothetical protein